MRQCDNCQKLEIGEDLILTLTFGKMNGRLKRIVNHYPKHCWRRRIYWGQRPFTGLRTLSQIRNNSI